MITLRQINYALAVSQTLHFKKAAEQCYVSASTLSNAITEMERQLGIKVFERNNKKVFITKLGKTFLEKAQNVKINVDDINQLQKIDSAPLSSSLNVGIIPTVGPYLLPIILPELKIQYPKLKLNVIEAQSEVLIDKIHRGEIEMGILALPFELKGLKSYKFWSEDLYWVSLKKDKMSLKKQIKAKDLELNELILLEEGNCLKDHILKACKINNSNAPSIKATSMSTLIELVKGGMGTTLIPEMAIHDLLKTNPDLSKTHLAEKGPHREIALITRSTYTAIEDVIELKGYLNRRMEDKKNRLSVQ